MDHQDIRIAIGTNALGKPGAGHDIESKLAAAKKYGFDGVEVAIECLNAHAELDLFSSYDSWPSRLRAAAADIYDRASARGLEIVALNPFGAFDGLSNEQDIVSRLEEAELWLQLCDELHAPILQVIYVDCQTREPALTLLIDRFVHLSLAASEGSHGRPKANR